MATAPPRDRPGRAGMGFAVAVVVVLGLAVLPALAGGSAVSPAISVPEVSVAADETTAVDLVLTTAPQGLSGYQLTVAVADGDVARIESVDYPSDMGLGATPELSDDGTAVRLRAADVNRAVEPASSDVGLVTLRLRGVEAGETRLTVDVVRMDDDEGHVIEPAIDAGRVAVTSLSAADASAGSNSDGAPDEPGIGVVGAGGSPADLAVGAVIAILAFITSLVVLAVARWRLPS